MDRTPEQLMIARLGSLGTPASRALIRDLKALDARLSHIGTQGWVLPVPDPEAAELRRERARVAVRARDLLYPGPARPTVPEFIDHLVTEDTE